MAELYQREGFDANQCPWGEGSRERLKGQTVDIQLVAMETHLLTLAVPSQKEPL
jgi:hypothetical protein